MKTAHFNFIFGLSLASVALLTSCSSSETDSTGGNASAPSGDCTYSYNHEATDFSWIAFKFTERAGVGGTFDEVLVSGVKENASTPWEAIQNLSFEIPVSSVNTQNPDRDSKIQSFFFGTLAGTDTLRGGVVAFNDSTKTVTIRVEMNEMERDIDMKLDENGLTWNLSTTIDVNGWNAQSGIDSLNAVCYDLHKGADGVSVLWPEVKLVLSTRFTADCD